MSHRPDHDPRCSKSFYLRPLTVPNGNVWYSCQPKGRHSLESIVKSLCEKAGFTGKRMNHSVRAGTATRMYECGIDEQLICEKTGHCSVTVRGYKRTSSNQLRDVSNVLYGNSGVNDAKKAKVEPSASESKPPSVKSDVDDSKEKVNVETCVTSPQNSNSSSIEFAKGMVVNINFNVSK